VPVTTQIGTWSARRPNIHTGSDPLTIVTTSCRPKRAPRKKPPIAAVATSLAILTAAPAFAARPYALVRVALTTATLTQPRPAFESACSLAEKPARSAGKPQPIS
jgi:hypothetical protein